MTLLQTNPWRERVWIPAGGSWTRYANAGEDFLIRQLMPVEVVDCGDATMSLSVDEVFVLYETPLAPWMDAKRRLDAAGGLAPVETVGGRVDRATEVLFPAVREAVRRDFPSDEKQEVAFRAMSEAAREAKEAMQAARHAWQQWQEEVWRPFLLYPRVLVAPHHQLRLAVKGCPVDLHFDLFGTRTIELQTGTTSNPSPRHSGCDAPGRCACECLECKRAWFAAGRPIADGLRLPHDACAS